jgi:hypothetical protein
MFGDRIFQVLGARHFKERSRYESPDGIALEYTNKDLAMQLVAEVHGKYVNFMPRNDPARYFPASVIMQYVLGTSYEEEPALDAVASFLEAHYQDIVRIFSLRDGGKELQGISDAVRAENARKLHYDRQWVREDK